MPKIPRGWYASTYEMIEKSRAELEKKSAEVKAKAEKEHGGLGGFWASIVDFFQTGFSSVWESFIAYFGDGFRKWGNTFASIGDALEKINIGEIYNVWSNVLDGYPEEQKVLRAIAEQAKQFPAILQLVILVNISLQMLRTPGAIAYGKIAQQYNFALSPTPPGAGEVMRAAFIAPERGEEVRGAMRRAGLSEHDIDLMFIANYALYPPEVVRNLYFRGELNEAQVNNRLSEMGFTPERIEELKKTFPVIPSIPDLVMMLAKEAFEPDQIQKFGLGAEFPQELVQWTTKQGLSEDWAYKYWVAHWVHPSWQQMMEALHRGIIDWDTVYEWYRLVEIPPYWRDMLTKISFNPYTRVDARRMFNMDVLSREELKQAYREMGYNDEHAEKLTQWNALQAAQTNRDVTKADILKAYKSGDIANAETVKLLTDIGYNQADADFIVWQAENELLREARDAQVEGIKAAFLMGILGEADARAKMIGLVLSNTKVTANLALWSAELLKAKKLPSKTDLDKWLRSGLIKTDKYYTEMLKLGYGREYIDLYFAYVTQTKGEL